MISFFIIQSYTVKQSGLKYQFSNSFYILKSSQNKFCVPKNNMCEKEKKFQTTKITLCSEINSSEPYLFENLTSDGGVKKKIIKTGSGSLTNDQSIVKVHYQGKIESGTIFDSSYERNEPYIFKIGEGKVIKGWEIGIKSMKIGEKALLEIFPNYGYKKKGIPPIIPPNAKLFYEVELLDIIEKNETNYISSINVQTPIFQEVELDYEDSKKKKRKFGNFFFISPFRSQTGQEAPWWLNPNITFLFVFVFIFFLFWIVWSIGGIHQGYVEKNFDANLF